MLTVSALRQSKNLLPVTVGTGVTGRLLGRIHHGSFFFYIQVILHTSIHPSTYPRSWFHGTALGHSCCPQGWLGFVAGTPWEGGGAGRCGENFACLSLRRPGYTHRTAVWRGPVNCKHTHVLYKHLGGTDRCAHVKREIRWQQSRCGMSGVVLHSANKLIICYSTAF